MPTTAKRCLSRSNPHARFDTPPLVGDETTKAASEQRDEDLPVIVNRVGEGKVHALRGGCRPVRVRLDPARPLMNT
jgi:hypothetical protein